jgi:hypothetical protein
MTASDISVIVVEDGLLLNLNYIKKSFRKITPNSNLNPIYKYTSPFFDKNNDYPEDRQKVNKTDFFIDHQVKLKLNICFFYPENAERKYWSVISQGAVRVYSMEIISWNSPKTPLHYKHQGNCDNFRNTREVSATPEIFQIFGIITLTSIKENYQHCINKPPPFQQEEAIFYSFARLMNNSENC